jgi:hypothetical protein
MEYWCTPGDDFWQQDDQALVTLAQAELLKSRLVGRSHQLGRSFVVRLRDCYPVYRRGYKVHLQTVRSYLESISGLQVIGRAGAFKYNNQGHSTLMGLLAAENLLLGNRHDLWAVNADSDTYQRDAKSAIPGLSDRLHRLLIPWRRTVREVTANVQRQKPLGIKWHQTSAGAYQASL